MTAHLAQSTVLSPKFLLAKKSNLAYPTKKKGYYNLRMCKIYHPNQPKLSSKEIQIIKEKSKEKQKPKTKKMSKECAYCQKVIERKNYFINQ